MNRPMLQKQIFRVVAWMALVAASALVVPAQTTSKGRSDSQIEMDVVQALDAAPQLKNDLITAATIQSEVTLSGTVATAEERKLAESLVAKVEGVAGVHNNLKVGDPTAATNDPNAAPSDDPMEDRSQTAQNTGQQQQPSYPASSQDQSNQGQSNQGQYTQGQNSQYPQQGQYSQYPAQDPYAQQASRPPYGQPQPPNGYGQPLPPNGYSQQLPPQQAYRQAPGPLTVPQGSLLVLRTIEAVESRRARQGEQLQFVVMNDVNVNGYVAIPRGATVHGLITDVHNPERGDLGGSSVVSIRLVSLDLSGRSYPLETDEFRAIGPNKAGHTAGTTVAGSLLGAVIGGIAGGGKGAAIGAGVGAGAGLATGAATQGPGVWIPSEARVDFHLTGPLTVAPVPPEEAGRLAQGLYPPAGPTLYQRTPAYYAPRPVYAYPAPYPAPYPYGYPPVYYRPYVMMGGYYHWR